MFDLVGPLPPRFFSEVPNEASWPSVFAITGTATSRAGLCVAAPGARWLEEPVARLHAFTTLTSVQAVAVDH
ncbi:hypothetical protein [Micromonospora sp. WMMA1976]|uniref:hypothetical protein n=1 Tax=Micromonospora sp. WMMA1976 TaxID=3014995 RepID=UPI00248CAFF4|nr:hypothetical protein [Micromonospora sp. WMMA1976]WBC01089.1 hypothetical protein O7546_18130 [Micromonospora sp. WMMA1976]